MSFCSHCQHCNIVHKSAFGALGESSIEELDKQKRSHTYKKGDFLFHKGENAHGYFCINSGTVRTFIVSANGKEQSFKIAGIGDWVGYRDCILGESFNHSAICLEDVHACYVSRELIETLLKDENFQKGLLKQIAKNWQDTENQVYSLGTKQIHSKLAELLVTLYNASESKPEIELKITREVMASIIGTTTESVIRALSDFKVRDWISLDKNKIVILNFSAVYEISEINKYDVKY